MARTKILLVGCGKMGGALLRGWRREASFEIAVVDPSAPQDAAEIMWADAPEKIDPAFVPACVVFAIKPQQMETLLPFYGRFEDSLFLSIAAGMSLEKLAAFLGKPNAAILRAMPNLPASVGAGITALVANKKASAAQKELGEKLMRAVGKVAWVADEDLIDAVTALSGSGPAYVFALCEAMAEAGEKRGLPPELAALLARETIVGSGALLAELDEAASALRASVTSKGGTTAAALDALLGEGGLFPLVRRAMEAAVRRAKELREEAN
jgi:pyrroline-5-carboxylate reductase